MSQSIVEYFAEHEGYRCGYCKSPNTNFSHGMWAHSMTPEDYERLLNRGWRRSGMYCYKPTNSVTCCPMYTISCLALQFNITKSQKKVLKKFNKYLHGGNLKSTNPIPDHPDTNIVNKHEEHIMTMTKEMINIRKGIATVNDFETTETFTTTPTTTTDNIEKNINLKNPHSKSQLSSSSSPMFKTMKPDLNRNTESKVVTDSMYPNVRLRKAKVIRLERKQLKMIKKGIDISTMSPPTTTTTTTTTTTIKVKQLEDYMNDFNTITNNTGKKFQIKLINTSSSEFDTTFKLEFELYKKYQMNIHGDKEEECTARQFKRFLCDSPINNDKVITHYGTFHQLYYIDDNLIAVGVIDILPTALSSVYFFYDPSYMELTLGTFGALQEISFIRQLNKKYNELKYYYMGFYIHSCIKMRYKGCFSPSYLQCPESYSWIQLDDELRKQLQITKYIPFGIQNIDSNDNNDETQHKCDINKVLILYRRSILPYEIYELRKGIEDKNEIQQYCNLVGEVLAEKLLLYRS